MYHLLRNTRHKGFEAVKQRLASRLEELSCSPDQNRLEREIIFYLEKLDITEEEGSSKTTLQLFSGLHGKRAIPGQEAGLHCSGDGT